MKRALLWLVGVLILGAALWYFLLKEHHYRVSFTTTEPPGIVYHHLADWVDFEEDHEIEILSKTPYNSIEQQVRNNDSIFLYKWYIRRTTGDETRVTAYVSDPKNQLVQKWNTLFGSNNFTRRAIKDVRLVRDALKTKAETYRVHSVKIDTLEPSFHAYISLDTPLNVKARTMLMNIATVMNYLNDNEIPLKGDPFLEVTGWNEEGHTIDFNFCFPIERSDTLPPHPEVRFKSNETMKGISAEFNGNYRISQNAWYYILDYAEQNQLEVHKTPYEEFLNDPHEGGNPLDWKALIFLPLKD